MYVLNVHIWYKLFSIRFQAVVDTSEYVATPPPRTTGLPIRAVRAFTALSKTMVGGNGLQLDINRFFNFIVRGITVNRTKYCS